MERNKGEEKAKKVGRIYGRKWKRTNGGMGEDDSCGGYDVLFHCGEGAMGI